MPAVAANRKKAISGIRGGAARVGSGRPWNEAFLSWPSSSRPGGCVEFPI
jgi:hypothetical protein